eukprot:119595_1
MATLVKDLTSSVMTGVSSFGNKALDAFGINQATLSGAIDIVVIKHPPGSRPRCLDPEYKLNHTPHSKYPIDTFDEDDDDTKDYYVCTPFHVRFGKLQLLRSNEVKVSITINDKQIDNLAMKLGIEGEAYFAIPTTQPLQYRQLLTSPLHKPVPSTLDKSPPLDAINKSRTQTPASAPPSIVQPPPAILPSLHLSQTTDSEHVAHITKSAPAEHVSNIETIGNSPTLSVTSITSSILEDEEVLSRLHVDSYSATGTDNESLANTTDNESNLESVDNDGADLFNNFSATHVMIEHIGMSLCGNKLTADSDHTNRQIFEQHKISYAEFCANPSLVFDSNLIILYNKRLYPAKIAFPQIFALLSFGNALSKKAIKQLNDKKEDTQHNETDEDYSWYWSWFKRKKTKRKKKRKAKLKKKKEDQIEIEINDEPFDITSKGIRSSDGKYKYFMKSLRPTSEMLVSLPLNKGVNNITFTVSSTLQGTQSITACIFLWDASDKIVISDVDGTITKSDVMGHVAPLIVGSQWSHNGVAQLFTNIVSNGYQMLYLTSRGIGQSSVTRSYLFENVKQRNFSLPSGPMIMSPDSLTIAFYREIIMKKPQEFKIPALENICSLFHKNHNPFYGGFGNRVTDLESYLNVGVPKHRIFIIKPSGAIYTNNTLFKTTYDELNEDVESMFMDRQNAFSKEKEEYNSFNFWRMPILNPNHTATKINKSMKQLQVPADVSDAELNATSENKTSSNDNNHKEEDTKEEIESDKAVTEE